MKKIFSLFAALLFTVAAMADTIDVKGYKCVLYNGDDGFGNNIVDYCLVTPLCRFHFTFDRNDEVEIGTTYTLDQMNFIGSYAAFSTTDIYYTDATFTKTGQDTYTAVATCDGGTTYNISIAPKVPIYEMKDTVYITANSKLANRLTDKTATDSIFQITGLDANNAYTFVIAFKSNHLAGTYNTDDIDDEHTVLWDISDDDTTVIPYHSLLPNAMVSGDASNLMASINYVSPDSVLYVIFFSYATPVASEEKDFVASDLVINMNYWTMSWTIKGCGVFGADASNADYLFQAVVYTDNNWYNGTYTNKEAEVKFYNKSDSMLAYEAYTTNFTLAKNGTALSLTGTALCYGDVQFNINITGDASAVESIEASDYVAYTEGHTIVLNGAEGQNVAIYDIAGRLISNAMVNSDNARFEVAAGVYVIRVNGQSLRVVVK